MKTLFETAIELGPAINQYVEEEEINRRLSKPVLERLREAGFHRLYLPESRGGHESDPLIVAKLVEEVASHNTAAGWSMMVANVSAWWSSRLPAKGIEEIYQNGPDSLIAGAFHPPM